MNKYPDSFHILLCTDISPSSESAAGLLKLFGFPKGSRCTLLGLAQTNKTTALIMAEFEKITAILGDEFEIQKEIFDGKPYDAVARFTRDHPFNLVVLGDPPAIHTLPFRPGYMHTHFFAEQLASSPIKPLLIARARVLRLDNILFCSGGEDPASHTLQAGARMCLHTSAGVSVLHVMSQVALENSKYYDELNYNAESAIKSGSPEGIHLNKAVEILKEAGILSPVTPRLRHGLVLDEVKAEIRERKIDLLVIGSHRQPGMNRFRTFLLEDVTRDLVNEVPCSVLIV